MGAGQALEASPEPPEEGVPGQVPLAVVQRLQAVQVQDHENLPGGEPLPEGPLQGAAVAQAREPVGAGLALQARAGP